MNDFIFKFHYREKPFQFVLSVKKKKKKKKEGKYSTLVTTRISTLSLDES